MQYSKTVNGNAGLNVSYDNSKATVTITGTRTSATTVFVGISANVPRNIILMFQGCLATLEKTIISGTSSNGRFIIQQGTSPWSNVVDLFNDGETQTVPTIPGNSNFFVGFQFDGPIGVTVNITISAHIY